MKKEAKEHWHKDLRRQTNFHMWSDKFILNMYISHTNIYICMKHIEYLVFAMIQLIALRWIIRIYLSLYGNNNIYMKWTWHLVPEFEYIIITISYMHDIRVLDLYIWVDILISSCSILMFSSLEFLYYYYYYYWYHKSSVCMCLINESMSQWVMCCHDKWMHVYLYI